VDPASTVVVPVEAPPPRVPPPINETNRPFWTGGARGELLIQWCPACARWNHPPTPTCPGCGGHPEARPVSGDGTIFTYTIARHQYHPDVPVPLIIAIVELAEQPGLRFITNIVGAGENDVAIGMPVKVTFEPAGDQAWAPTFTPV